MTAVEWLASAGGALLIVIALRDVFHTLLHPAGTGKLSPLLFRAVWRIARRIGRRAARQAGPLAVVATILTWAALLMVGWGLIYWPHLPEQFQIAEGVNASEQDSVLDAIYLSGVALATLGFGDIVAEEATLRLALVAEALIGFSLLTASISWVLSIYPSLLRSRALAGRLSTLLDERDGPRLIPGESATVMATILYGLGDQLATARVDLIHYPSTYFFRSPSEELSLAAAVERLDAALRRDDLPAPLATAAATVRSTIHDLGDTLQKGPFGLSAEDPAAAIRAYADDHRF